MAIEPSERGSILNDNYDDKHDLSSLSIDGLINHIQGIVQAGDKYTVLSSSAKGKELILAYNSEKKIVQVKSLPENYEHAGGIDALEVTGGWMIAVPVWSKDDVTDHKGAIIFYFLSQAQEERNQPELEYKGLQQIKNAKAYAVGIAPMGNNGVVMAVMIDKEGNKVLFSTCTVSNGLGGYSELGKVWKAKNANRDNWEPDKNWGSYPNSISLIEHDGQIYFVGMHNTNSQGMGKDWIDLYRVNLDEKADDNERLIKVDNAHVRCDDAEIKIDINLLPVVSEEKMAKSFLGPSFRWGGSAKMQNGILEVIAVERNFFNYQAKYNKFCFKIDPNQTDLQLIQCQSQLGDWVDASGAVSVGAQR